MSNIDDKTKYHIRFKNRILGPYNIKQLMVLRDKGQLTPSLEVSTDGTTWQMAENITEVFPGLVRAESSNSKAKNRVTGPSQDESISESSTSDAVWHYSLNEQQMGPVTLNEIQEMMYSGQLTIDDVVWMEGMSDWQAIGDLDDFHSIAMPNHRNRRRNSRESMAKSDLSRSQGISHFLDPLLNHFRRNSAVAGSITGNEITMQVGLYASSAAMCIIVLTQLALAAKRRQTEHILVAATIGLVGTASQFAAIKCCDAMQLMIRAAKHRMSSTALLDSMTVILISLGALTFVASVFAAIDSHIGIVAGPTYLKYIIMLLGFALAVVIIRGALQMLNPAWAGITITDDASPGESAIANIYFLVLIPWFFVPGFFVVVSVAGLIGSVAALVSVLTSATVDRSGAEFHRTFADGFVAFLAIPIGAYIYFLGAYIAIDFVRSVLILPNRSQHAESRSSLVIPPKPEQN